jgi:anaerobic magnesium-protoporphyrin IX monomethyl ester cyclase
VRIFILNPSIRDEQFGRFAALLEPMPCIGVAYVATFLSKAGHEVLAYDDFALRGGAAGVLAAMETFKPQVFAASVLTPVATDIKALLRKIKDRWPDIKMFLGNIHADLFPEEFLDVADAVVHGEGEHASVELVKAWEEGRSGEGIAGVTLRVGDQLRTGPKRVLPTNLDAYPFPDWGLLPYSRYSLLPLGTIQKPIVAIAASRGCPFRCTYCSIENQGKIYRKRSIKNVVDEIEYGVRTWGIKQYGFMDPIFPMGPKHGIEFSKEMIRRGLNDKIVWLAECRTDVVDKESLVWLKKSGCRRMVFGIESGVDTLLKAVKKQNTADRSRQTIQWCREVGITTVGLFMIGLPNETPEQTQQTIEYACSLELDFAKFAITVPFPGSELYREQVASGILTRKDWENYTTFNPDQNRIVVASQVQSPDQLLQSLREATFRFYMRPRLIARQLVKIRSIDARQMAAGIWSVIPDARRLIMDV